MRCDEVMSTNVFSCRGDQTLGDCAQLMRDEGVGFVPVVDKAHVVIGAVTDRDLVIRGLARGKLPSALLIELMTPSPLTSCRPRDELALAESKMITAQKSRIVVLDDQGLCVGILSLSDVAQAADQSEAGGVLKAITRRRAETGLPRW